MIDYQKFWETLNKKGITKYALIYHYGISSNTLRRMSKGEPITTTTINQLCLILHCKPQEILTFVATDEEKQQQKEKEMEIAKKKHKK